MPFSLALFRQLCVASATLFLFFMRKLFSGEMLEKLRRRLLAAELGVANEEPVDEEKDRKLRGVYGVEYMVAGVYGELVI